MIPPPDTFEIPLLVITGPTASGKTGIAIELAKQLNAEIVGADSMQVYRQMNIGTDTPAPDVLGDVVHHMIDIVDPNEDYDTARFARDCDRVIGDIHARHRRVIVAGGTGLYIRVLLKGLLNAPPPDPEIRRALAEEAAQKGWPELHRRLEAVDPETARRLHPNDGVRISRALEVFAQTRVPISTWQRNHAFSTSRYPFLMIGIHRERTELVKRINRRVDSMMTDGFLDEVQGLLDAGYAPTLKPMGGLGYRQLCAHLAGNMSLAAAVESIKTDTRRFSKRQVTWFRSETALCWMPPDPVRIKEQAEAFFGEAEKKPRTLHQNKIDFLPKPQN